MQKAIFKLAVGGAALSVLYLLEATRYSLGTLAEPGPGLFPLIVSGILLLGFVGMGIEALASGSKAKVGWPSGTSRRRVAVIALSCVTYVFLLPYVGHLIAGSLLSLAVLHVMALRSWTVKLILSAGIGIGSYVLFGVLLGVPFPRGTIFG